MEFVWRNSRQTHSIKRGTRLDIPTTASEGDSRSRGRDVHKEEQRKPIALSLLGEVPHGHLRDCEGGGGEIEKYMTMQSMNPSPGSFQLLDFHTMFVFPI